MSSRPFIPVCEPFYMGNEEKYALDAINSRWISSMGSYIEQFENGFSAYCQASHGISTTSGTTALHLALAAMGIGEGDEVVIPDFTMVAVLFAVLYCRATPVFVDADASTWNMDISKLESAITEKTACIIPVHIYGHPVDMDPLLYIAKKHSISVVEDAAQAI